MTAPRDTEATGPALPSARTDVVIENVGRRFGVTIADLKGPNRSPAYAWPRQMAYAEVKKARPHLSMPEIGKAFGGRDHTTILHGIRAHEARMAWAEILIALGAGAYQPDLFARGA